MYDIKYSEVIDKLLETIEEDKKQSRYILDYDLKKLLKDTFESEIKSAYDIGYDVGYANAREDRSW